MTVLELPPTIRFNTKKNWFEYSHCPICQNKMKKKTEEHVIPQWTSAISSIDKISIEDILTKQNIETLSLEDIYQIITIPIIDFHRSDVLNTNTKKVLMKYIQIYLNSNKTTADLNGLIKNIDYILNQDVFQDSVTKEYSRWPSNEIKNKNINNKKARNETILVVCEPCQEFLNKYYEEKYRTYVYPIVEASLFDKSIEKHISKYRNKINTWILKTYLLFNHPLTFNPISLELSEKNKHNYRFRITDDQQIFGYYSTFLNNPDFSLISNIFGCNYFWFDNSSLDSVPFSSNSIQTLTQPMAINNIKVRIYSKQRKIKTYLLDTQSKTEWYLNFMKKID